MADWIDDLVRNLKQKYNDQRTSDQKYVLEENQKHAAGRQFMATFQEDLQKYIREFNARMGGSSVFSLDLGNGSLTVKAQLTLQEMKTTTLRYLEPLFQVAMSSPGSAVEKIFRLTLVGGMAMVEEMSLTSGQTVQMSASDFAKMVLTKLIQG